MRTVTMRTVPCRRATVLGVAAVVLLAACRDGEPSAPATTVPPAATTLSQVEVDRQKGRRIVLSAADLPGFTQEGPGSDDSAELEAATNACLANDPLLVRLGEDDDPRGARSPDFRRGQQFTVNSGVTFGETDEEVRAAFTALGAPSFPGCFSDALAAELGKDPNFTDVSVTTAGLPALGAGDQSVGYRTTAQAAVRGQPVTLHFDFTFIRSGRALSVISGLGVNAPYPESERSRLATTVAGRMAAA